jgi:hypothetical protein
MIPTIPIMPCGYYLQKNADVPDTWRWIYPCEDEEAPRVSSYDADIECDNWSRDFRSSEEAAAAAWEDHRYNGGLNR